MHLVTRGIPRLQPPLRRGCDSTTLAIRLKEGFQWEPAPTTIAHGYLTLSLLVPLLEEVLVIENRTSSVNYGLDKVRFPAPVPSCSRVRLTATLAEVTDVESGVQVKVDCVFQIEDRERPVCVARAVLRRYFAA